MIQSKFQEQFVFLNLFFHEIVVLVCFCRMRLPLLLSPLRVSGSLELPLVFAGEGPTTLAVVGVARDDSTAFERVWLSFSDSCSIDTVPGSYRFVDRDFCLRTHNGTESFTYHDCPFLTEIHDADDASYVGAVQLGIGPGSPIMNFGGSVDIVSRRLILGQSHEEFAQRFCLPETLLSVPYSLDTTGAGRHLRMTPNMTYVVQYPFFEASLSWAIAGMSIVTDRFIGFEIPETSYNDLVDVINIESPYWDDTEIFPMFASCARVRNTLPIVSLVFEEYGQLVLYPEDYTEMVDADQCILYLMPGPINGSMRFNPLRLTDFNIRLTDTNFTFCDSLRL